MPYRRKKKKKNNKNNNNPRVDSVAVTTVAPALVPSLVLIPQEDVAGIWPLVEDFLGASAKDCDLTPDQFRDMASVGDIQLWVAWSDRCEAAALTRVIDIPRGVVCELFLCGGEGIDRWKRFLSDLETWAAQQGCGIFRVVGRPGLAKLEGYKMTGIVMDKALHNNG
jgi:hypothetical protein